MKQLRVILSIISIMLFLSTFVMFMFDSFIAVMVWFAFIAVIALINCLPDVITKGVWIRRVH
jgi:hypothetical protein